MVSGTKNMWLPLIVSLFSLEVSRCDMNLVILNINGGGGAEVPKATPEPEKEYFVFKYTNMISIEEARDGCISQNGIAVVPESAEEVAKIKNLTMPGDQHFIPTSLKHANNQYEYADSTPYTGSVPTHNVTSHPSATSVYLDINKNNPILRATMGSEQAHVYEVICEKNTY